VRRRIWLFILAAFATAGAVAIGAWWLHAASVWSQPPSDRVVELHYRALRLASLTVAATSVLAALLAFLNRTRIAAIAAVLLLTGGALVVVGLQLSPAHLWFGSVQSFHVGNVLRYPHRFRTAAVFCFAAAISCLLGIVVAQRWGPGSQRDEA
jgi:hypothetical protein